MESKNIIDNLPEPSEEEMRLIISTINQVTPLSENIPNDTQIKAIVNRKRKKSKIVDT